MNEDQVLVVNQSGYNLVDIANLAIALGILIAGGLSIFYIFAGGISFILSGGQEDKIKQAVHTIRYAIIGLIITIFAVTVIAIVGSIFGFELTAYIRWDRMTEMISNIVERITSDSEIVSDESLQ
jgi:inner membrane protein involved in colicin E2 resistance